MFSASNPPTTSPTTRNCTIRVTKTVENTERKPTSPNHNQATYVSTSRDPTISTTRATAPTAIRILARRERVGTPAGGRLATGHAPPTTAMQCRLLSPQPGFPYAGLSLPVQLYGVPCGSDPGGRTA